MCASTANRTSPSSQDRPHSFPFSSEGVASSISPRVTSHESPVTPVGLPSCSASHEVARGDSSLFRISPGLPRLARRTAACGRRSPASRDRRFCQARDRRLRPCRRDSSVFSSSANCRLSASAPPTFVPRIGRSPVRRFFSILSAVSCELSTGRPERGRRVNCFAHFALCHLLCFHTNTTIKFCNPFILITMQIAGGWGYLLEVPK